MNDTTQTLLRSILKIGGGYLVAKGIGDQSTMEIVVAGVASLVGVIWGYLHRKDPPAPPYDFPPAPPAPRSGAPLVKPGIFQCLLPHPCVALVLLGLVTGGCAYNRPHLQETVTVTGTNGIITTTTRDLTMRSYVLWPASAELAKQKASIGKVTMGVGTEGLGQESGGTNVVDALRALDSILGKVRP